MTSAPRPRGSVPSSPVRLTGRAWRYALVRAVREFLHDQVTDKAAALTYYAVLSIFPALIALVSLLGLVGQAEETTRATLDLLGTFLPAQVIDLLRGPIGSLAGSTGAGWGLALGVLAALWSASNYVNAFSRAANGIYEVPEGRPLWKRRAVMYGLTALLVVLVALAALLLVLSGPLARAVGDVVGLGATALTVWSVAKWPVLVLIAVVIVATLYDVAPNVRQPRLRWISPGAVLALLVAAVASLGFGFYVSNFSHYDATYGTLAGVVIFLLWLWIMDIALLLGVELDVELERARELQSGLPAAARLHVPLRDTAKVEKDARTRQKLIDTGEQLAVPDEPTGSGQATSPGSGQATPTGRS